MSDKMEDQFGKMSLGGGESGGSGIGRTPSTSSSQYNKINANLHARVKAFQEQRVLKRSNSGKSTSKSVEGSSGDAGGSGRSMQQIVNKPLPPLPMGDEDVDRGSSCDSAPSSREESGGQLKLDLLAFNPNRMAPKKPGVPVTGMPKLAVNDTVQNASSVVVPGRPKQSLSARRGLKLPPGGMTLKSLKHPPSGSLATQRHAQSQDFAASPQNKANANRLNVNKNSTKTNPGSLINGVQQASTSSSAEMQSDSDSMNHRGNSSGSGSSGSGGLFANFSRYVDIKSGSLNFAGKLSLSSEGIDFNNGSSSHITLGELEYLGELGHGNYGNVSKVLHKPTNVIMAMKEVRLELDESKFRQILMELEVLHKCNSPYIVDFFGAFFIEGAVYMCMEFMDGGSLDKIYDDDPIKGVGPIDEPQLAYITESVIRGLKELKDEHNIIHRDVKPTNILCSSKRGTIKLCDFGVSGNLVASLAKTNIGCQSYMAPERIRSANPDNSSYSVQSDVWSLGLTILEMASGRYPYAPETFDNIFSQLSAIVDGPPPRLPQDKFSAEAQDFVHLCLQKAPERRPTYAALLNHPWLAMHHGSDPQMSDYIGKRIIKRNQILQETGDSTLQKHVPALHMGGL